MQGAEDGERHQLKYVRLVSMDMNADSNEKDGDNTKI